VKTNKRGGRRGSGAARIALSLFAVVFVLPLVVTFIGSLMTEQDIYLNYSSHLTSFDLAEGIYKKFMTIALIPERVWHGQYADVLIFQPAFLALMLNSIRIALPVTLLSILVSLPAAYALTVLTWRHKEKLFLLYIVAMLLPLQAVLVPNYLVARFFGIEHSALAIILPGIFSPFGVFLLRQAMRSLPVSYFEAARIDGASHGQIMRYIVLPQMGSSLAALAMLTFIEYWNVVEQAVVFISDYTKEPLSVYLSRIASDQFGLVFAASCVYMAIPLWFLFTNQEDLEKGIELSGVKG